MTGAGRYALARGGTWNPDGVIVFTPTTNCALLRVAATGGPLRLLRGWHLGKVVIATRSFCRIAADSSFRWRWAAGNARRLCGLARRWRADACHPRRNRCSVCRTRLSLVVSQEMLAAYPFDAARGTVAGEPIPVAQGLGRTTDRFTAFSVSSEGVLAHRPGGGSVGNWSGSTAWAKCSGGSARRTKICR